MSARHFKYLPVFTLPALVYVGFVYLGFWTYLPFAEAFLLIPLIELFSKPDPINARESEEQVLAKDKFFDFLIYLIVPLQYYFLFLFLERTSNLVSISAFELVGLITSMGLLCGIFGINVAHELGHRKTWYERTLAQALLLTSQDMHFYIEHNRGHHKRIGTDADPATARLGEVVFQFWFRSAILGYFSAWKIENEQLRKKGLSAFSLQNQMLRFQIIQLTLLIGIFVVYGPAALLCYLAAAAFGILLFETVNYIEHYGLLRTKLGESKLERVGPQHSWDSDHIVGRIMLFELSRHSDHHMHAQRKYQILRHSDKSPKMPTGYPGMILLSLIPPLWFKIMNREMQNQIKDQVKFSLK